MFPFKKNIQPKMQQEWEIEPYLHVDKKRIYNPLTEQTLHPTNSLFKIVRKIYQQREANYQLKEKQQRQLLEGKWIIPIDTATDKRFRLRYVSLEGNSACNQACYFCPVAYDPRDRKTMSLEVYEHIVQQLAQFPTLEGVFMMNYNEPTIDRYFKERIALLFRYQLPVALNTNASGLTPKTVEHILKIGQLGYLNVNLSTLDPVEYHQTRGQNQLPKVLENLDYLKQLPFAKEMVITVLGQGDLVHKTNFSAIQDYFTNTNFKVQSFEIMDRAGYLEQGQKVVRPTQKLCGCDNLGSRPLQHLHIDATGKCVLCCEDYEERYEIGDLSKETIIEVLEGKKIAQLRKWIYGIEKAPQDFICRRCIFARTT
ncbi:MAG: radical SAM/SPASM domain-containing protein [Saprospiraceae bacterium]